MLVNHRPMRRIHAMVPEIGLLRHIIGASGWVLGNRLHKIPWAEEMSESTPPIGVRL